MSISAGVVVSVAFQQVNGSPNAETGTEGDDEGLENADSRVEKFHICVAGIIRVLSIRIEKKVNYFYEVTTSD